MTETRDVHSIVLGSGMDKQSVGRPTEKLIEVPCQKKGKCYIKSFLSV
jgi:hypothetical protein